MRLVIDSKYCYAGYHGTPSHCRLRLYEAKGKASVVILTEREDNPGTSITNRIEHIATMLYRLRELPESGMEFIEHYPDRAFIAGRLMFKEHFDKVTFTLTDNHQFTKPVWKRISKSEVEAFIGQPFPE